MGTAKSSTPLGRLVVLEKRYKIKRAPLKRQLQVAVKQQTELDQYVRAHSTEAKRWKDLARKLPHRQQKLKQAVETLSAELKESVFGAEIQQRLDERFEYLAEVLDDGLAFRIRIVKAIVSFYRIGPSRKPGRLRTAEQK